MCYVSLNLNYLQWYYTILIDLLDFFFIEILKLISTSQINIEMDIFNHFQYCIVCKVLCDEFSQVSEFHIVFEGEEKIFCLILNNLVFGKF